MLSESTCSSGMNVGDQLNSVECTIPALGASQGDIPLNEEEQTTESTIRKPIEQESKFQLRVFV